MGGLLCVLTAVTAAFINTKASAASTAWRTGTTKKLTLLSRPNVYITEARGKRDKPGLTKSFHGIV
jgi:hypothetical protein